MAAFGSYINGFSGSFSVKPLWYTKEMESLDMQLGKIDKAEGGDDGVSALFLFL